MTDVRGLRVVVLDDPEGAARVCADWSVLDAGAGVAVEVDVLDRHVDDEDELVALLDGAAVVVCMRERTPLPRRLLERLPALRLVVTTGARNAAIDVAACTELGITVCGTRPGGTPVVELAWALVLAALRHVPAHAAAMADGQWRPRLGHDLAGRRLGLVGLGRTGSRMARIAAAFDMDVVAWSQNLTAQVAAERGARLVPADELFATSDVVSLHLVLSERTRGLVDAQRLRSMRPDAWLVNTSRAGLVDTDALVTACREGWIAGAAVDVFDVEPLPADHPLRALPTVLLTPHAGYTTWETFRVWFGDVVEDVAAWLEGSPIRVIG